MYQKRQNFTTFLSEKLFYFFTILENINYTEKPKLMKIDRTERILSDANSF